MRSTPRAPAELRESSSTDTTSARASSPSVSKAPSSAASARARPPHLCANARDTRRFPRFTQEARRVPSAKPETATSGSRGSRNVAHVARRRIFISPPPREKTLSVSSLPNARAVSSGRSSTAPVACTARKANRRRIARAFAFAQPSERERGDPGVASGEAPSEGCANAASTKGSSRVKHEPSRWTSPSTHPRLHKYRRFARDASSPEPEGAGSSSASTSACVSREDNPRHSVSSFANALNSRHTADDLARSRAPSRSRIASAVATSRRSIARGGGNREAIARRPSRVPACAPVSRGDSTRDAKTFFRCLPRIEKMCRRRRRRCRRPPPGPVAKRDPRYDTRHRASFSTTPQPVRRLCVVVENTSPPHLTALAKKLHSSRFTRGTRGAPSCR